MAVKGDFDAAIGSLNTATNDVAARIDRLIAKIQDGGIANADEASVLAELGAISARMTSLAADPADPVPTEPPAEEPPAETPTSRRR